MAKLTLHWTEKNINDFLYKVAADLAQQIENILGESGGKQNELADNLGVTPGRVSQVLNNPGNLTLRAMVRYARALGKKVAVVAYDDGDPKNANGPINSQVFEKCWENAGRPGDFFAIEEANEAVTYWLSADPQIRLPHRIDPASTRGNTSSQPFGARESDGTDAHKRMAFSNAEILVDTLLARLDAVTAAWQETKALAIERGGQCLICGEREQAGGHTERCPLKPLAVVLTGASK